MPATFLSVLPPFLVILTASVTRKLNSALLVGILSAGYIASNGSVTQGLELIFHRINHHFFDGDILYLYLFLLSIGVLVALLTVTGGAIACANSVTSKIKNKNRGPTFLYYCFMRTQHRRLLKYTEYRMCYGTYF